MKRRSVLLGMVGLTSGASALVSTGAFTSVEADRSITVETAGDADAFLGIEPAANEEYVSIGDDGLFEIDISDLNGRATTTFDPLCTISNNGTQTVQPNILVEVTDYDGELNPSDIEDSLAFFAKDITLTGIGPTAREDLTGEGANPGRGGVTFNLGAGDEVEIGLEIDFTDENGAEITPDDIQDESIELTATILAEE